MTDRPDLTGSADPTDPPEPADRTGRTDLSGQADSSKGTERLLVARLDQAAGRVRGRAVTRTSIAERVTTRARHRRQARMGAGALAAAVVLVAGLAVANGRDGAKDQTVVRSAGQPGSSSPVPSSPCAPVPTEEKPTIAVPPEIRIRAAMSLMAAGLLTGDQARTVLADRVLLITKAQGDFLYPPGPETDDRSTVTAKTPASAARAAALAARAAALASAARRAAITPPPLKPGQTPFDAWADALRAAGLLSPEQEANIQAGGGISLTTEQGALLARLGYMGAPIPPIEPPDPRSLTDEQRTQLSAYAAAHRAAVDEDGQVDASASEPCTPTPDATTVSSTTSLPPATAEPERTTAPSPAPAPTSTSSFPPSTSDPTTSVPPGTTAGPQASARTSTTSAGTTTITSPNSP